jgi:hypothetical protein
MIKVICVPDIVRCRVPTQRRGEVFYYGQFNGHHMTDFWYRTQVAFVSLLTKTNEDDLLNRSRKE